MKIPRWQICLWTTKQPALPMLGGSTWRERGAGPTNWSSPHHHHNQKGRYHQRSFHPLFIIAWHQDWKWDDWVWDNRGGGGGGGLGEQLEGGGRAGGGRGHGVRHQALLLKNLQLTNWRGRESAKAICDDYSTFYWVSMHCRQILCHPIHYTAEIFVTQLEKQRHKAHLAFQEHLLHLVLYEFLFISNIV